MTLNNHIPLSLYIHIPWCVKKCPYCDFNSHEKNHLFDEENYLKALILDLRQSRELCSQTQLTSLFFGGGTPSLFSAKTIKRIIDESASLFDITDAEITLEANPGTFEQEKFAAYRDSGVNRLSIGIQSFDEQKLTALGRIHNADEALNAINTAKSAGFENINLDLMFGLPQQTLDDAVNDINIACQQRVNHISHYQLTLETNTYFHKHPPVLPEMEDLWEMQTQCQKLLTKNNYTQYEISAYAQDDQQSQHNMNYWQFGDYLGIGAGAHGKISDHKTNDKEAVIKRQWKHRQPTDYINKTLAGNACSGSEIIDNKAITLEFLMNALRLKGGCKTTLFLQRTGLSFAQLQSQCAHIDKELLTLNKKVITTTDKGFLFLNEILENLI